MVRIITLDWETYYDAKDYTLSKMGPIEYIRDSRFTELCLGIRVNKEPTYVVELPDIRNELLALQLDQPGTYVVGHNMNGFDALILSEIHNIHPWCILDTMTMMRWSGLSRMMMENHKTLTAYFGHGIKQEGTVVSNGKRYKEDFTPAEWQFFKQYCADDVTQCSENAFVLLGWMTQDAVTFSSMTAKMATQPVLQLDGPMLAGYITELDNRAQASMKEISEMFHFNNREEFLKAIRSKAKFCDMLRILGTEPPMKYSEKKSATMKAKLEADLLIAEQNGWPTWDIQMMLDNPSYYTVYEPALAKSDLEFTAMLDDPDPRVALLVQTRLEHNSSIERSRAVRFYELSKSGKPLPIMLKAFHAHTSRYGAGNAEGKSDGTNVQNISKRDPQKLTLRRSIKAPAGHKLVSVDSSQIEARMLAFIAGELELVEQFREGRDPYSELAEKIFSVPWQEIKAGAKSGNKKMKAYRNVGKTAILSAGYGVGATKFSNTLLRQGVHLSDDLEQHHEMAKHAHMIYRMSNNAITSFWKECQRVIEHLCLGGEGYFGTPVGATYPFHYAMLPVPGGAELVPSIELLGTGYTLRYPGLRWERNEHGKVEYFYDRPRGKNMVKTRIYGGALTENLIQALAFQLLMWQACRIYEEGIPMLANIHDAWLSYAPEAEAQHVQQRMEYWMSQVPEWLKGFPVACEGEIGDTYEIA